ncbi:MAG: GerW family sporulation protein [Oscillospiraceae bacterium]|nr:GerW family sporulation protein [Oscillospiraceae bacterium]
MENNHPINDVISVTMEKVRQMVDVNTIVGTPIIAGDVTIIPISKLSFGFGSGGSELSPKNHPAEKRNPFGGGAAAGCNIDPVAFLVVREDSVRLLPVNAPGAGAVEKIIDLMPEIVNKVTDIVNKKKAGEPIVEPDPLADAVVEEVVEETAE